MSFERSFSGIAILSLSALILCFFFSTKIGNSDIHIVALSIVSTGLCPLLTISHPDFKKYLIELIYILSYTASLVLYIIKTRENSQKYLKINPGRIGQVSTLCVIISISAVLFGWLVL